MSNGTLFRIIETALKQPCMQEKIPKVYLRLLEMVKQYRSTSKCPLLTWKELRDWNVIADEETLRRAAQLLHDWGELLYFSDSPQLKNLVRARERETESETDTERQRHIDRETLTHSLFCLTLSSLDHLESSVADQVPRDHCDSQARGPSQRVHCQQGRSSSAVARLPGRVLWRSRGPAGKV
jgi:hypothetical protein